MLSVSVVVTRFEQERRAETVNRYRRDIPGRESLILGEGLGSGLLPEK
jgi:hypothetical protein